MQFCINDGVGQLDRDLGRSDWEVGNRYDQESVNFNLFVYFQK